MAAFTPLPPDETCPVEEPVAGARADAQVTAELNPVALFETNAAGIAEVDIAGRRFTRVNQRLASMMRLTGEELLALAVADVLHPDDLPAIERCMRAMRGPGYWNGELRYVTSSAETIWVRIGVSVSMRNDRGVPVRCIAILQDATDSVTAREQLRVSEQLLRLGQEVGRIGSFSRDLATGLLSCGEHTRAIYGLPLGQGFMTTEEWMAAVTPEDRERFANVVREAIKRRDSHVECDFSIRRFVDGSVRHIEMRARYNFDAKGRPVSSMGIVIDVTERKEAEERLRASETLLRMGMKIAEIGAFRRNWLRAGEIECGLETRLLHGLPVGDEPIPQEIWLATLAPEDAGRIVAEINDAIAARVREFSLNYRFRRPNESEVRYMEARACYEYDASGAPISSVGVLIDVTERKKAEDRLAFAAQHDALTGLPNRVLFRARLSEAFSRSRRGESFALLCLDLDRFKEVNDTLGHHAGDELLKLVAARLRTELREFDTLARLGGDEFVIIQSNLSVVKDAAALARRLIDRVSAPFDIEGIRVVVGLSVGIAVAPANGATQEDLFRAADLALYRAKSEGRGRWRYFEPEMNALVRARRTLETDLRHALERREFLLLYQPILDLRSQRVKGFEALIRWRHPVRGLVLPNAFIPICEETGLIEPLGEWILRRACADAVCWPAPLGVAVNLSAVQFSKRDLEEVVVRVLGETGLPARRLELEITERAMLHNSEAMLSSLTYLRNLGVRIALDDFGSGFSSLSCLQRFPFDKVKIDQNFVSGIDRSSQSKLIVKAVAGLCKGLGMTVTAEAVETDAQLDFLASEGCDEAQGYLFSAPRAVSEIPALCERFGVCAATPHGL